MDDLKVVKAQVKSWERSFKAEHNKLPTKADIKAVPEIAAKYALYRKLSKEASSGSTLSSQSSPQPTPLSLAPPPSEPLITPRKPKPPTSFSTPKSQHFTNPFASPRQQQTPGRSTQHPSNAYRKPIQDPSPNPFSSSESPFIHASSPKKLKSLLEATSMYGGIETTPRTRARKRLRGEEVDDTPGKGKVKASRLGRRPVGVGDGGRSLIPGSRNGRSSRPEGDGLMSTDEESENGDFIGPTPIKSRDGRTFSSIFDMSMGDEDEDVEMDGRYSPAKGMSLFGKGQTKKELSPVKEAMRNAIAGGKGTKSDARSATSSSSSLIPRALHLDATSSQDVETEDDLIQLPPDEVSLNADHLPDMPESPPTHIKVDNSLAREIELSSSDDEMSDGENTKNRSRVRIEPYRLGVQKRLAQRDAQEKSLASAGHRQKEDEAAFELDRKFNIDHVAPEQSLASLALSPTSKILRRTMALQETRARAVFDSRELVKLKASKQAPVWGAGEVGGENENDAMGDEADTTADDDWESDQEGWKAMGLPDDDDW